MEYLTVIITNKCNLNCSYCLRDMNLKDLDLDLFEKILKQASEEGCKTIFFSGGECFLHSDFFKMVELVVKYGLRFGIMSNGFDYMKYEPVLKYKDNFERITFSLDSASSEKHDRFRGVGSFDKVMDAIEFFKSKGIRVHTQICLRKDNKDEIENYFKLNKELGVDMISFMSVIPTGKADEVCLSDVEKMECVNEIGKLRGVYDIRANVLSSLFASEGVEFCSALNLCDMAVNPNGEIKFCCDVMGDGGIIGDLKEDSFSEVFENGKKIKGDMLKKRLGCILSEKRPEGFSSCVFCNKYFEER
ncbi:radical SAM protein [archaeon]|jgi:MoaA/NifB/PqqE/SkfB family radical SAM enzyme|nr:radical SAM protein [archaeon]MBT7128331.1 radical SAM protein [archaeon]